MRRFYRAIILHCILFPALLAQGRTDYFNVESPLVHPIEVFRVTGRDYLAVCNNRDNSLEIWDTSEQVVQRRLARVRTGVLRERAGWRRTTGVAIAIQATPLNSPASDGGLIDPSSLSRPEPAGLAALVLSEAGLVIEPSTRGSLAPSDPNPH